MIKSKSISFNFLAIFSQIFWTALKHFMKEKSQKFLKIHKKLAWFQNFRYTGW